MATLKYRLNRKNASGTYDTIHYETSSNIVMRPSGRTVEQDLTDFLPRSQNTDDVPQSLTKGTIVCANNRVFAGCNSVRQLANLADIPAKYVHPATKQCNYSYTHPSTKVCTGGDAGTLNGKTAAQIISQAASSSSEVIVGTYTGDGQPVRLISLGRKPKAVYVCSFTGLIQINSGLYGGLALQDAPAGEIGYPAVSIVDQGFQVYYTVASQRIIMSNFKNTLCYYIAWL